MSTDLESVNTALADLRDVADTESKSDQPDLRKVHEAYEKFSEAWVGWRMEELRKEDDPDSAQSDNDEVKIDEKVVEEAPKPDSRRSRLQKSADESKDDSVK